MKLHFKLLMCSTVLCTFSLMGADNTQLDLSHSDKRLVEIIRAHDRDQFYIFGPYWHNSLNLMYDHQFTTKIFSISRKTYQDLLIGTKAAIAEKKLDHRALQGRNITSDEYHAISDNFHIYMQEQFDRQTQEIMQKQSIHTMLHIIWIGRQIGIILPPDLIKKISSYASETIHDETPYRIAHAEMMIMLRYADALPGEFAIYTIPLSADKKKRLRVKLPQEITDLC